jgi:peptide/nickel transport system substrate-binding protein
LRMISINRTGLAALTLALIILTAGCSKKAEKPGGAIVIGLENTPTNLDPRFATDAYSARICQLMFNGLVRMDEGLVPRPDLSDQWSLVGDRTYIFNLRQNVYFHDGTELTAEDVKYTFESILDPTLGAPGYNDLKMIEKIDMTGKYEVRIKLKEVFSPFLSKLDIGIVPANTARKLKEKFATQPVGTGPYMMESFVPDDKVMLAAYGRYFGQAPKTSKLIFRIIPNEMTRIMEIKKGSVHLLMNCVSPDFLPDLEQADGVYVESAPGTSYSYIGLNLRDPVLKDVRVRKAIAHAVDRRALIRHMLRSYATEANSVLSPGNWAYSREVTTYEYNPALAKKILDEAGYRQKGQAPRFTISYKTSLDRLRQRIGEAIADQLKQVGIGVDTRTYEWGTFFADIKSGNFQIYTLTWVGIKDPDILHFIFHSSNFPPAGANRGAYANTEVDQLLDKARKTYEKNERKALYERVQKILAEEVPYVGLWYYDNVVVMRDNVMGFKLMQDGGFETLAETWLK